ncbi:geminin [Anopheles ziemanni]|uniref:geminin n=1 Tax=Anopheles coustani TaxID=139045 RepID=UPI0026580360|nr:geminin [Anopheles coustani]XP_058176365.1 geminin [Anopheles ziemanni]
MSASSTAIIIPEDSSAEQEEIKKSSRMMLKERDFNTLKENMQHGSFPANARSILKGPSEPKRSKMVASKSTQTASQAEMDITAENPSENYWMSVAEQRRIALGEALAENADLHITVSRLQSVLEKTNTLNRELQEAIDTLTELLTDDEVKRGESDPVDDSGVVQGNDSCFEH